MEATYDITDDAQPDPFVSEGDVAGLYHPDVAALASRATASDPGSGPTMIDD